jgi:hypothetical protein
MHGSEVNTLSVHLKQGGQTGDPVWMRSGDQNDGWKRGQIRIGNLERYQIVFQGSTSKNQLYGVSEQISHWRSDLIFGFFKF